MCESDLIRKLSHEMSLGSRVALSKLISIVEHDLDTVPTVLEAVDGRVGEAYTVGVTGPPGAGKSTLVDGLIGTARSTGSVVGVLAVDPTSARGTGAILGDRVRMSSHSLDEGVFVRSMATRGALGGLSRATSAGVRLLEAFGTDLVLVESVGVGQTELDVMTLADTTIVVVVPEAGDSIQMMKAGLMEIADIFVVNKADREGAHSVAHAIEAEVRARKNSSWWTPPVLMTQAHKRKGLGLLQETIDNHRRASESSNKLEKRRAERRNLRFKRALKDVLEDKLTDIGTRDPGFGDLSAKVKAGKIEPYVAAAEFFRYWDLS